VLPPPRRPAVWQLIARQLIHFFALMLWIAALLAAIANLMPLAIGIVVVIILNAVFAFVQEYRADRAAARLRSLLPRRALVRRDDDLRMVNADELVVGDCVVLGPGDRVSADLRLTAADGLRIDTSLVTGESVPVDAMAGAKLFAGSHVVEGEAEAHVVATGPRTRLAGIQRLTTETPRPAPPLVRELQRVVRTISGVAIGAGVAFFVLTIATGSGPESAYLVAIGVTVALVPEALLPTVTLSLALGGQRMARRSALVRRLESVETLGSTTFICTDKTGTLTRNEMAVVEAWTPSGGLVSISSTGYDPEAARLRGLPGQTALLEAARAARATSTGRVVRSDGAWEPRGDPMEAAIDVFWRRLGGETPDGEIPFERRFPFDPRRRRASAVVDGSLLVKGAPDSVLGLVIERADALAAAGGMAARGRRVLAVACRPIGDEPLPTSADEAEQRLTVLGVLGLEDPPRTGAAAAIAACRGGGIRVAMVTGDHAATARAIADEVGLRHPDDPVLEGSTLPEDDDALAALIDHDGIVLARVIPEDKVRIARALRSRGHVVAMTGDGVNDGPALHEADIGVAMGRSGTDVARETSDLVLLDDDFATIVAGVEEGRAIYANARRFLTYHLTDNVAELTPFAIWALSGGAIPLALGVLQILALDIGTDTLSATALGAEPPRENLLKRPPARGRLLDGSVARRAFGLMGPVEGVLTMTAFFASLVASGWVPGSPFPTGPSLLMASGAAFATVVIAQTANAFACRSTTQWPGSLGWTSNRLLVWGASIELLVAAACLLVPAVAEILGHRPPALAGWAVALASAPVVLGVDAAAKAWRRRTS
jgi:magnesium-transporting ATPase (P-type)